MPRAPCAATMTTRASQNGTAGMRIVSAIAPKTLLTASQPMQLSQLSRPGRMIDFPNGSRAAAICASPSFGPMVLSSPTKYEPTRLPTMTARIDVTRPSFRKSSVTSVPMKNAAGTRLGVNQTVNTRPSEPYRADSGIGSKPWLSIFRSPSCVGMSPTPGMGMVSAVIDEPPRPLRPLPRLPSRIAHGSSKAFRSRRR